jgi:phenylacetate-CoA ligase
VFEKYGSFEIGVSACECTEHNGMHMFLDGVFFEFLNSAGDFARPGEIAQLVVTDLFNYGFPLIRYKIGDVGIYTEEACPCGSPLPLMSKLFGRDRDILVDQYGNPKPGYLFVEVFNKNHIPGQFQVIQEDRGRVIVRAVKKAGYTKYHEDIINEKFRMLLGVEVKIEIVYVEDIPREASGKYIYVQSKISPFKKNF